MGNRITNIIVGVISLIAIVSLIIGLFLTSIEWVAFDMSYYDRQYKKLNISQATGISQPDLFVITDMLLEYLKGERVDLNILAPVHGEERMVFNDKEIAHMVDVKALFLTGFKVRWVSYGVFAALIIILIIMKARDILRQLSKSYLISLSILAILSLVLILFILIDFNWIWSKFHHIFFSNDLWILDPDTDILIQMVPEQFFFNTIIRILTAFGSGLVALGISSGTILWTKRSNKEMR